MVPFSLTYGSGYFIVNIMTKFSLISDLHLEFADLTLPGGEVLLIAGDACEAGRIKPDMYTGVMPRLQKYEGPEKRADRHYRFFKEECAKYDRVLYIVGNHEHYGGKFNQTHDIIRERLSDTNVELLERDVVDVDGTLVVGTTLWSDVSDPMVEMVVKESMNDYHSIRLKECYGHDPMQVNYRRLRPADTVREFYKSRDYIDLIARENPDKKIVVMTHHGPSKLSIDPMYDLPHQREMNRAYYSDLDQMILDRENIKVWCHGHTHTHHDYELGQCRVICNPRGYYGYETIATKYQPLDFEI